MGSCFHIADGAELFMKNVVADTIIQYVQEHLESKWRNDAVFAESFQTLRLFDMLLLKELDDERYSAFFLASCKAIEVYANTKFATSDWQGYIVEIWREVNELMKDHPRVNSDLD